jgi:hypothetical protein
MRMPDKETVIGYNKRTSLQAAVRSLQGGLSNAGPGEFITPQASGSHAALTQTGLALHHAPGSPLGKSLCRRLLRPQTNGKEVTERYSSSSKTMISTRRFCCRPASDAFEATG